MKYTREYVEMNGRTSAGPENTDSDKWVACNILRGAKVYSRRADQSVTPCLIRDGFWEAWITAWFLNEIENGYDNFIDIGANSGYYAALAGKYGIPTVAVEPNPLYTDMVRATGRVNGFKVVAKAISDKPGSVTLHTPGTFEGSASIVPGEIFSNYEVSTVDVPAITLDELMLSENIDGKTLIKIDTEGAEEMVWAGANKARDLGATFLIEYSPNAYTSEFVEALRDYGHITYVDFAGQEVEVSDDYLASITDWLMLVIRKR